MVVKAIETPLAQYANQFRIGHNQNEFVIECCQQYAGSQEAALVCRLVLTPTSAEQLRAVLDDSLQQHLRLISKHKSGGQ
jgi:hypothetical protein